MTKDNWIKGRLSISEVFEAIDDVVACESCDPVCRLCLRDRKKLKGMVRLLIKQQTSQVEHDAIEKTNKRRDKQIKERMYSQEDLAEAKHYPELWEKMSIRNQLLSDLLEDK